MVDGVNERPVAQNPFHDSADVRPLAALWALARPPQPKKRNPQGRATEALSSELAWKVFNDASL